MQRIIRRVAVALALLGIALPAGAQPKPYTIDVILALTGSAAALGADEEAGFVAYEKVANRTGGLRGQPIHFQIYDDQSNPAVAVSLLGPILARKPAVVFGSTLAGPTQAMAALVKDGPVLYATTPNVAPEKDGYVFAAGPLTKWYNSAALRYYRARRMTRLATVTTGDASGQNNLAGLEGALAMKENASVQVVDRETFGLGDISMTSQAARLKAANPQVVFAYPNGTAFGTALHGLSDVGVDLPVYTSGANLNAVLLERFKALLPTELTTAVLSFFDQDRPASDPLKVPIDEFHEALAADGIAQPSVAHMFAWDPARIVVAALREIGPNATAAQLHDRILRMRHFAGAGGYYDFTTGDQHGLSQDALLIARWDVKSGRLVVVSKQGGDPLPR